MITQDELKFKLHYDPDLGIFTWVNPPSPSKVKKGQRAGVTMSDGYRSITLNKKMNKEHRLAWLYMTGSWPSVHMDHINRDRGDNRFVNLRLATQSQNVANRTSWGKFPKGVSVNYRCKTNPYRAQIEMKEDGKRKFISLGVFKTTEEAHNAFMEALKDLHPEHAAP